MSARNAAAAVDVAWLLDRDVSATAIKLGHTPMKCATSYECPRCSRYGYTSEGAPHGAIFTEPCK